MYNFIFAGLFCNILHTPAEDIHLVSGLTPEWRRLGWVGGDAAFTAQPQLFLPQTILCCQTSLIPGIETKRIYKEVPC